MLSQNAIYLILFSYSDEMHLERNTMEVAYNVVVYKPHPIKVILSIARFYYLV